MYLLVEMYVWTGSRFFVIYHTVCNWISSQDVNVLLVGPLFPFPWFSGGCVFLGSVFSRVLSLRLSKFSGAGGLLVLCVVVDGFCLDVAFTSGGGECLHTILIVCFCLRFST